MAAGTRRVRPPGAPHAAWRAMPSGGAVRRPCGAQASGVAAPTRQETSGRNVGKEDDLLDGGHAGQQHGHPVDARCPARPWAACRTRAPAGSPRRPCRPRGRRPPWPAARPRSAAAARPGRSARCSRWPAPVPPTYSSKRSIRYGSCRSTRASGLISTGWSVTKTGPVRSSSTVASNSSSMTLPDAPVGHPRDAARVGQVAQLVDTGMRRVHLLAERLAGELDHAGAAATVGPGRPWSSPI